MAAVALSVAPGPEKDVNKMLPMLTAVCYPPKIKCVFLAQFDNTIGRIIRCQHPSDFLTKEKFEVFAGLVIPQQELCNKFLKHETSEYKIMGHAVSINNPQKYDRNFFMFNLCFIVEKSESDERILEPVLQKAADYLVELEKECDFLSNPVHDDKWVKDLVRNICVGLSKDGGCNFLATSRSVVALEITMPYHFEMKELPSLLLVPAFTRVPLPTQTPDIFKKMDMVSQKIIPVINGVLTIREISQKVKIDVEIVGRCVRQLIYCGLLVLFPQFLYSNCYYTTDRFKRFLEAKDTQKECCEFVKRQRCLPGPEPRDVIRLYAGLRPGWKLSHWHSRFNPRRQNVDERKLIQFGIYYGFVRRQDIFPVALVDDGTKISKFCNGEMTIEDLALKFETTTVVLLKIFDASPSYTLIYR